jgi:hypothetical protein
MKFIPLLALLLVGCHESSPLVSGRPTPIASSLSLTAFRDGATVRVTALLRSAAGENIVGQAVTFNASSGSVSPTTAVTGESGMAGTIVTTDAAVTISATNGSIVQTTTAPAAPPPPVTAAPPPVSQPPQPPAMAPWRITADRIGTTEEGVAYFLHARTIDGATSYLWTFSNGDTTRTGTPVVQYVFEDGDHVVRLDAHDREYRSLARAETGVTARR